MTAPTSITCPECGMTSHNPNDVKYGYCGNCHDYTGQDRTVVDITPASCLTCGEVPPFHRSDCSYLDRARTEVVDEFGSRHPSVMPVVVDQNSVHQEPRPGGPDWLAWCELFEAVVSGTPEMRFSQAREIARHLWRLGYRRRENQDELR